MCYVFSVFLYLYWHFPISPVWEDRDLHQDDLQPNSIAVSQEHNGENKDFPMNIAQHSKHLAIRTTLH